MPAAHPQHRDRHVLRLQDAEIDHGLVERQQRCRRKRSRRGVDLDREPERARELIGANAWELVRPERTPPTDRLAPGPPLADLRVVVDEIERL